MKYLGKSSNIQDLINKNKITVLDKAKEQGGVGWVDTEAVTYKVSPSTPSIPVYSVTKYKIADYLETMTAESFVGSYVEYVQEGEEKSFIIEEEHITSPAPNLFYIWAPGTASSDGYLPLFVVINTSSGEEFLGLSAYKVTGDHHYIPLWVDSKWKHCELYATKLVYNETEYEIGTEEQEKINLATTNAKRVSNNFVSSIKLYSAKISGIFGDESRSEQFTEALQEYGKVVKDTTYVFASNFGWVWDVAKSSETGIFQDAGLYLSDISYDRFVSGVKKSVFTNTTSLTTAYGGDIFQTPPIESTSTKLILASQNVVQLFDGVPSGGWPTSKEALVGSEMRILWEGSETTFIADIDNIEDCSDEFGFETESKKVFAIKFKYGTESWEYSRMAIFVSESCSPYEVSISQGIYGHELTEGGHITEDCLYVKYNNVTYEKTGTSMKITAGFEGLIKVADFVSEQLKNSEFLMVFMFHDPEDSMYYFESDSLTDRTTHGYWCLYDSEYDEENFAVVLVYASEKAQEILPGISNGLWCICFNGTLGGYRELVEGITLNPKELTEEVHKIDPKFIDGANYKAGTGINITGSTISNTGVISVNGSTGSVAVPVVSVSNTGTSTSEVNYITVDGVEKKIAGGNYTAGNGIAIWDKTISNTGVTSVNGLTGSITVPKMVFDPTTGTLNITTT